MGQIEQKSCGRLPPESVLVEHSRTRDVSQGESHVRGVVLHDRVRRALREEAGIAFIGFCEVTHPPGAGGEGTLCDGIVVRSAREAREFARGGRLRFDRPGGGYHGVSAEPRHRGTRLPKDRLEREPKYRGGGHMSEFRASSAARERDTEKPEPDSREPLTQCCG